MTDPRPRGAADRRQYDASEALRTLALPPALPLHAAAGALAEALQAEQPAAVRRAGTALLRLLATFYAVSAPKLRVLGSRPHQTSEAGWSWELFGDYTPGTETIRVWMRTAVLAKVTSFRGLLNTLLHEFCHHLDILALGFPESPHTRGFYGRVDELYHLALATPPDRRKPLVWVRQGATWRIDWRKLRP